MTIVRYKMARLLHTHIQVVEANLSYHMRRSVVHISYELTNYKLQQLDCAYKCEIMMQKQSSVSVFLDT